MNVPTPGDVFWMTGLLWAVVIVGPVSLVLPIGIPGKPIPMAGDRLLLFYNRNPFEGRSPAA